MKKKLNIVTGVVMSLIIITFLFVTHFCYAQGQSEATYLYHKHTGTAEGGGGCYAEAVICDGTLVYKTRDIKCGVAGSIRNESEWVCYLYGHVDTMSLPGGWYEYAHSLTCQYTVGTENYYECDGCGSIYDTVQECTKQVSFKRSCGVEEGTPMVSCQINKDMSGWCSSLNLQISSVNLVGDNHEFTWNWNDGSSGEILKVTENGTYTAAIPETDNLTGASISINVSNIDSDVPVIREVRFSTYEPTTCVTVTIHATDTTSGLAGFAYRWDGGSYEGQNTKTYDRNGIYSIQVRDAAGNAVFQNIFIENIVELEESVPTVDIVPEPEAVPEPDIVPGPAIVPEPGIAPEPEVISEKEQMSGTVPGENIATMSDSETVPEVMPKENTTLEKETMEFPIIISNGKDVWLLEERENPAIQEKDENILVKDKNEAKSAEATKVGKQQEISPILKNKIERVRGKDVLIFTGISIGTSLIVVLIFACISGYCTLHKKKKSDKIAMSN